MAWWDNAVIYQVYPRSFRTPTGTAWATWPGSSAGSTTSRSLGADAVWLSPIYPSPLADFGYDVSDYEGVDPVYGTLDDFDRLVEAAHARGLRLLMDLVPCHTSIEHPWFRERPDFYVWADGDGPPNNWLATFGGRRGRRDDRAGRWYLHSFYPEQPDLDWRNPDVVAAMQDVVRFWLDRGVDGFRLDAIDRLVKDADLRDDPPASAPFGLPLPEEYARLEHLLLHQQPGHPPRAGRAARGGRATRCWWARSTSRRRSVTPYLDHLDAAFAFELFHAPWDAERPASRDRGRRASGRRGCSPTTTSPACPTASAARTCAPRRCCCSRCRAWCSSTRARRSARATARRASAVRPRGPRPLPPPAPVDRRPADGRLHERRPVAAAGRRRPSATWPTRRATRARCCALYRELIALRPKLGPGLELLDAEPGVVSVRARGVHGHDRHVAPG